MVLERKIGGFLPQGSQGLGRKGRKAWRVVWLLNDVLFPCDLCDFLFAHFAVKVFREWLAEFYRKGRKAGRVIWLVNAVLFLCELCDFLFAHFAVKSLLIIYCGFYRKDRKVLDARVAKLGE